MKTSKYTVKVIDLDTQKEVNEKLTTARSKDGKNTILTIDGQNGFIENHVYRLETTRYLQIKEQDNPVTFQTVKLFHSFFQSDHGQCSAA